MNTCKFFLQGTCKFGDSCKFSHQIDDLSQSQGTSIMRPTKPPTIDTTLLVKSVITDMTNAEKGGHWLLSSYAPFKDKPCFPGFENRSFEEVRWCYYEAMKNGTVEQYKQQLQIALQEAAMKMKALQNPTNDIAAMLVQIYNTPVPNQNTLPGPFSAQPTSVFGQNSSPLSQNQQQDPPHTQGASIIGQNNPPTIDTTSLIKSAITDMTLAEKGGQWLLSSYAPFEDKACFPGFENRSFEEVRWSYCIAVKKGTVQFYKKQLQVALLEAEMKMRALQNPTDDIVDMLMQIYNSSD